MGVRKGIQGVCGAISQPSRNWRARTCMQIQTEVGSRAGHNHLR